MADSAVIDHATGIYADGKDLVAMTTAELQKFISNFRNYLETKVKNETPEESREILIRTGVLDENGDIILRHGEEW